MNDKLQNRIEKYVNNLRRNFNDLIKVRYYLLTKIQEELGEYAEGLNFLSLPKPRKLNKFNISCDDAGNCFEYDKFKETTTNILKNECIDTLFVVLCLAYLEGITTDDIPLRKPNNKKE